MSGSPPTADVAIVGGGPAGAAAALVLARSGVDTVLINDVGRTGLKVGEGLPPAAKPLLRSLGLWEHMRTDAHRVSHGNESAWGDAQLRSTSFMRDPNGHGWHLDRETFDARLQQTAQSAGARVMRTTRAEGLVRAAGTWTITLRDSGTPSTLSARWLIDCTGRRAWAARLSGASRTAVDHLVAFVCRYRPAVPEADSMTLVESAPDGWWYTSCVPNGDRVVAYLTDAGDASARRARTPEGLSRMVAETQFVRARLAGRDYVRHHGMRIVAADTSRLDRPVGEGWLAAGDAATSFDPLSSQGILTAIDLGMTAAHSLVSHLSGEQDALAAYGARVETVYAAYLAHRREYYAQERRWAHQAFWRLRHGPG